MVYSDAYVEHLSSGPFPGRTDPWAESAKYFHQIHGGMIGELLENLRVPLMKKGYIAGRETSLQITARSQPDILVQQVESSAETHSDWSYEAAAVSILAEPGVAIAPQETSELDAIHIRQVDSPEQLITVVEVISPTNKDMDVSISEYRNKRYELVKRKGVNFVEIDVTRSIKRLVDDLMAKAYPYHIMVHLPEEKGRIIGMNQSEALKRFALPLHYEVMPVELQSAYDAAYRQAAVAAQIDNNGHYTLSNLPFPSLMNSTQKQDAWNAMQQWQDALKQLRLQQA